MKQEIVALALLVAAASVMPHLRHEAWWIRIFDFPRLQILALSLLVLALSLLKWHDGGWQSWGVLAVAGAAAVSQIFCIFPYTLLARKEVLQAGEQAPEGTFSLLISNVLMSNRSPDRLLDLIGRYQPDAVLLLEPDDWWEERMRVLETSGYSSTVKEPRVNRYGMLLYSRLELIDPEIAHLCKPGIPSFHTRIRLRCGNCIWLHGVHPEPPSPTEADSSLPRDAELLIVAREAKEHGGPTIVAGDLNDVAWSYTTRLFQKMSSLLDPRKGRGMFNTYHAYLPFLRWPLDHVFLSDSFVLAELRRLSGIGSDHFPVFVRLVLRPELAPYQQAPEPDRKDREIAEDKLARS